MCPLTTTAYCYICVLMLLWRQRQRSQARQACCYICVLTLLYVCPHTTICVFILLQHTAIHVSSHYCVSAYYSMCGLTLLYMCPHTRTAAGAEPTYVRILLCMGPPILYMCPHTTIHVSSYERGSTGAKPTPAVSKCHVYLCCSSFFYYYYCNLFEQSVHPLSRREASLTRWPG